MTIATATRRTVRIDRSPPRRVLTPLRWRSVKSAPDRTIWDACWSPVARLIEEGWRLDRIVIDWGQSLPLTAGGRDQAIRELCGCYDGCEVVSGASGQGRGSMTVELVHDDA